MIDHVCPVHGTVRSQALGGNFYCNEDDADRPGGVCGRPVKIVEREEEPVPEPAPPPTPPADPPEREQVANPPDQAQEQAEEEPDVKATCEQCQAPYDKFSKALRCPSCLAIVPAGTWYRWKREYGLEGARDRANGRRPAPKGPRKKRRGPKVPATQERADAEAALVALGHSKAEATRHVEAVPESVTEAGDIVKAALNGGKDPSPARPVPAPRGNAPTTRAPAPVVPLVDRIAALEADLAQLRKAIFGKEKRT